MVDPYEEEQRARFEAPMEPLLIALQGALGALLAARQTRDAERHSQLYDRAMNIMFNVFNLANPVAHVRQRNGRIAFMWIDYADRKSPPSFRWVVCLSDGTFRVGAESSQKVCEAVADAYLEGRKT